MTQKEIIKGNKLIAEFLGWKTFIRYHFGKCKYVAQYDTTLLDDPYINESDGYLYEGSELFYSSWDWLMPVVKKAWEITSEFQYDDEEYLYITEEIFYPDNTLSEFMNNNITDIWRRVVEFIKWYNKSNDKTKTSTKITV